MIPRNDIRWKPNKERLLATLRGEIPDRVPYFESLIESRVVRHILGRDAGSTMAASRGNSDKDAFFQPPMDPHDYLELIEYTGQDSILMESLWVPMKVRDHKGDLHAITGGVVETWEDLDKLVLPTWDMDIAPRKKYLEEYVAAARKKNVAVTFFTYAPMQYIYEYLMGFETFCMMVYEDWDLLERCMDLVMDYYEQVITMAIEAGVDIIWLADDVAYKAGTFIDPKMFEKLWMGRTQKMVKLCKDAGIPVIFHSCGNVSCIMDSVLVNLGIDCLHPIEPYKMDIYDIKPRYQDHFCIAGNIDIAGPLAFGTPEAAYEETAKLVTALKPGGKYILASSHSITNDIPPENFDAMLQALWDHGRY